MPLPLHASPAVTPQMESDNSLLERITGRERKAFWLLRGLKGWEGHMRAADGSNRGPYAWFSLKASSCLIGHVSLGLRYN